MFFGIDPLYFILVTPALLLSAWATYRVRSAFGRYQRVGARSGWSGADVARRILADNGIRDVQVEAVQGSLVDHYDPKARVLRLSADVYAGRSISALGVAAHEAGHALQHAEGYAPLQMRSALVPMASLGTNLSWILFFAGIVLAGSTPVLGKGLVLSAIALFSIAVVFTLVTLPVEFDASRRALLALEGGRYLDDSEMTGARRVLRAAALTYLAAALMAIAQLVYFLVRSGLLGGRSND
jgi:Zn-dependent membrane protease YugP